MEGKGRQGLLENFN